MIFQRSCKQVTRMVLASGERPLRWQERVALRLHWMMCSNCARFRQQARTLRSAVDRWRQYREE